MLIFLSVLQEEIFILLNFYWKMDNLPVWNLAIGFTSLTVERALSAKAIEFKDRDFSSRQEERLWFLEKELRISLGL